MPRINRKIRVRPQNRTTRAQILELLIGPNGESVFADETIRQAVWAEARTRFSAGFLERWYASGAGDKPYAAVAEQYACDVVAGRLVACEWVRLACARHLKDLERAAAGDWMYRFDERKAARVCRFLELLPHVKGNWAAKDQAMVLEPWQVFLICVLFGWVKAANGLRRFQTAYIEVARKNGKSQLAAGIGLYLFACDQEFGAEVYSGATKEEQAQEVFRPARQMMERSFELAQALGIVTAAKRIYRPEDGSRFQVVVGKPGDGASPHGGIVDEYHEHDSDTLFDTFRTGMGARQQPMLFVITTAGFNTAGPCMALHRDVEKILRGVLEREDVFAIIYTIDPEDDWTSEIALIKANPNYGVSVFPEFLRGEQSMAVMISRKQNVVKTKHLCIWCGANTAYFNAQRWRELADAKLRPDQFTGQACVVSADLSTKKDITARILMFRTVANGKENYYVFPRFYVPAEQVMRPEMQDYQSWVKEGHLIQHPGGTVDFEVVERETIEAIRQHEADEFCFDPWNAAQLGQGIGKRTRAEIVEIPQSVRTLSGPMKELDALILDGRIHHDGNPVLTWMISNVAAHEDANENVFPCKEGEESKIDGAVATIMALSRLWVAGNKRSVYEERGLLVA